MNKHQTYFNNRKIEISELPDTFFIESYMGCNLRCKMCPVSDPQKNMNGRNYSSMSFETYKIIIDQLSDKCRYIRLNQLGEPLLNPEIVDFIAYAVSKGHRVGLTTNGTKLDAALGKKLIMAGLNEIVFSFDGCKKETYERIRVGAGYDEVLANITEFAKLNKQLQDMCEIRVDCIISDLTFPELEQIRMFWGQSSIPVNFIPIDDWAGKLKLPAEFGIRRSVVNQISGRYPCHLLWASMAISSEGKVIYCCHDYKQQSNLPSVKDRSLQDIWNSELRDIRRKHVMGAIEENPCMSCDAWMTMPEFFHSSHVDLNYIKSKIKTLWARHVHRNKERIHP